MVDALHGKTGMMATMPDLYSTKAALVIGTDLAQEHPLNCVPTCALTGGIIRRTCICRDAGPRS